MNIYFSSNGLRGILWMVLILLFIVLSVKRGGRVEVGMGRIVV